MQLLRPTRKSRAGDGDAGAAAISRCSDPSAADEHEWDVRFWSWPGREGLRLQCFLAARRERADFREGRMGAPANVYQWRSERSDAHPARQYRRTFPRRHFSQSSSAHQEPAPDKLSETLRLQTHWPLAHPPGCFFVL